MIYRFANKTDKKGDATEQNLKNKCRFKKQTANKSRKNRAQYNYHDSRTFDDFPTIITLLFHINS